MDGSGGCSELLMRPGLGANSFDRRRSREQTDGAIDIDKVVD